MMILTDWLQHPTAQRLGWTLLHFFWQGAVAAVVFALLRAGLRERSAQARYLAGCATLILLVVAPIATFVHLEPHAASRLTTMSAWNVAPASPNAATERAVTLSEFHGSEGFFAWAGRWAELADILSPWLVAAWLAGVLLLSARLMVSWIAVERLRHRRVEPVETFWLDRLQEIKERLGVHRPVRLLKSALVQVPTVIGWFRPAILLPASTLTGLSPTQLELVLAHELAHLRRYDHWVNLLQILAETVLFYHPAVWWISGCIREEREHCCDDLAVRVCGNRLAYAQALATLEELRSGLAPLAFAANGGSLLQRIRRVLGLPADAAPRNWRRAVGGAFLGLGLVLMGAGLVYWLASPKQYVSTVRIQVEKDKTDVRGVNTETQVKDFAADQLNSAAPYDPYFLQTEFERIQSKTVLYKVIERLKLNKEWAAEHHLATPVRTETTYLILRSRVEVRPTRNTSLIEIRVVGAKKNENAVLANEIASVYEEQRRDRRRGLTDRGIDVLKRQMALQDEVIRAKQEEMDKLKDQFKIVDLDATSATQASVSTTEELRRLEASRLEAQRGHAKVAVLYDHLRSLPQDQLKQAAVVNYPDTMLTDLLRQENESARKLAELVDLVGPEHADLKRVARVHQVVTNQVNERLRGFMLGLKAQVDSKQAELDAILKSAEEMKVQDIKHAIERRPFFRAKRDLETLLVLRDKLQAQINSQQIDAQIPRSMIVEVVDPAEPGLRPIRPHPAVAASLMLLGILTSLTGALLRLTARFAKMELASPTASVA